MRAYVMGFDQEQACKLGLSLEELLIVRWFSDFYASPKAAKLRVDGADYMLIVKTKLMNDLPILGVGDRTISRHMESLIDAKVLIRHMETTDRGTRAYYAAGECYAQLIGDTETAHLGATEPAQLEPMRTDVNANTTELSVYVQTNIGHLTSGNWHDLNEFMSDGISDEMVRFAVDECVANKKPSFSYMRTMFNRWMVSGYTTLADVKAHEEQFHETKARTDRRKDYTPAPLQTRRMEDFEA